MISDSQFALNFELMIDDSEHLEMVQCYVECLEGKGTSPEKIESRVERMNAKHRRRRFLKENRVAIKTRKHLVRLSNVRYHNGMMQDGTCHYEQQVTVAGNTYPIKDELKRAGFKWDAGYDLWFVPMTKKWSWAENLEKATNYVAKAVLRTA